ncbi:MAG: hypothetical protein ABWK00_06055 [Desulfurococcaceae archaeon]
MKRLRAILGATASLAGACLSIAALAVAPDVGVRYVPFDYAMWASTILSLAAVWLALDDILGAPAASVEALALLGAALALAGRMASLVLNALPSPGVLGPLAGHPYTPQGLAATSLIVVGSSLVAISLTAGLALRRPPPPRRGREQAGSSTVGEVLREMRERLDGLLGRPAAVAIAAFAFGFAFRFLPEIRWWPWLIGWDTVEYVAHLEDFLADPRVPTTYYWMGGPRNLPPLLDLVLAPFAAAWGAWNVFKVYPSVAFGLVAALSSLLAMKVYDRGWRAGLMAGFMSSVFLLNLRISWDYQRQLLGTVLMLAGVLYMETANSRSGLRPLVGASLAVLCGLSHEVAGLAGFALATVLTLESLGRRSLLGAASGLAAAAANYVLEAWYWGSPISTTPGLGPAPLGVVGSLGSEAGVVSYLVAGYGLTLPMALSALAEKRTPYLWATVAALMLAGISPVLSPYAAATTWYRFLIGAAPLISTAAAVGASAVLRNRAALLIYLAIYSLPGLAFAYAYDWSGTLERALENFPQALTPASAHAWYIETYEFFANNWTRNGDAVIVARTDLARYIHLALRNPSPDELSWASYVDNATACYWASRGKKLMVLVWVLPLPGLDSACIASYRPASNETPWIVVAELSATAPGD